MDILSTLLVLIGLGLASVVVFLTSRKILRQLFGAAAQPTASRFDWVSDPADANRQARARAAQPGTKRQALYRHLHQVGPELRRRHGAQRHYRPDQVRSVMTSSRSNRYPYDSTYDNDCYGYATYCTQEDFDEYHRSIGESCDYGGMRQEICQSFDFLPGGADFDAFDVFDVGDRLATLEVAGGSGVAFGDVNQSSGWAGSSQDGASQDDASNALFDVLENADSPQSSLSDSDSSQNNSLGANSDSDSSGAGGSFWSNLFSSGGGSSSDSSSSDSGSSGSSDYSSSSGSDYSSSSSSDYSSSSSDSSSSSSSDS
jgi:hypothetical protein